MSFSFEGLGGLYPSALGDSQSQPQQGQQVSSFVQVLSQNGNIVSLNPQGGSVDISQTTQVQTLTANTTNISYVPGITNFNSNTLSNVSNLYARTVSSLNVNSQFISGTQADISTLHTSNANIFNLDVGNFFGLTGEAIQATSNTLLVNGNNVASQWAAAPASEDVVIPYPHNLIMNGSNIYSSGFPTATINANLNIGVPDSNANTTPNISIYAQDVNFGRIGTVLPPTTPSVLRSFTLASKTTALTTGATQITAGEINITAAAVTGQVASLNITSLGNSSVESAGNVTIAGGVNTSVGSALIPLARCGLGATLGETVMTGRTIEIGSLGTGPAAIGGTNTLSLSALTSISIGNPPLIGTILPFPLNTNIYGDTVTMESFTDINLAAPAITMQGLGTVNITTPRLTVTGGQFATDNITSASPNGIGLNNVSSINGQPYPPPQASVANWALFPAVSTVRAEYISVSTILDVANFQGDAGVPMNFTDVSGVQFNTPYVNFTSNVGIQGSLGVRALTNISTINGAPYGGGGGDVALWANYPAVNTITGSLASITTVKAINVNAPLASPLLLTGDCNVTVSANSGLVNLNGNINLSNITPLVTNALTLNGNLNMSNYNVNLSTINGQPYSPGGSGIQNPLTSYINANQFGMSNAFRIEGTNVGAKNSVVDTNPQIYLQNIKSSGSNQLYTFNNSVTTGGGYTKDCLQIFSYPASGGTYEVLQIDPVGNVTVATPSAQFYAPSVVATLVNGTNVYGGEAVTTPTLSLVPGGAIVGLSSINGIPYEFTQNTPTTNGFVIEPPNQIYTLQQSLFPVRNYVFMFVNRSTGGGDTNIVVICDQLFCGYTFKVCNANGIGGNNMNVIINGTNLLNQALIPTIQINPQRYVTVEICYSPPGFASDGSGDGIYAFWTRSG